MVRKTKEEAEQTKNAILAAALDTFCAKGYSRTTFDDIAASINLTKGAVYWHFKNKLDLLTELIRKNFYENRERIKAFAKDINSVEDLRELHIKIAQMIVDDDVYRRFLFFLRFHMEWSEIIVKNAGPTIREIVDLPLKDLTEVLVKLQQKGEIRPELNAEDTASIILYLWRGTLDHMISGAELRRFPEIAGKGFDLLVKSIKNVRN